MLQQFFNIQYQVQGLKKNKGQGSSERYQKILFKNLFLRFKSKYLCCNVTLLQHFEQKSIIFSDISIPRIGKNMSIAMQIMTESQKSQLTKHSKKFSCRLEKYNTYCIYQ